MLALTSQGCFNVIYGKLTYCIACLITQIKLTLYGKYQIINCSVQHSWSFRSEYTSPVNPYVLSSRASIPNNIDHCSAGGHFIECLLWPSWAKFATVQYLNLSLYYVCTKFGSFITKCTTLANFLAIYLCRCTKRGGLNLKCPFDNRKY